MEITKIEVTQIKVPLIKPLGLSKVLGTAMNGESIVVKVFTDEGIVGLGEASPLAPFTEETSQSIKACLKYYLGPAILGTDPTNIVKIHEIMNRSLKLNAMAKGSIDLACYDILGKEKELPVFKILGGNIRSEISIAKGLGGDSPEDTVKDMLPSVKMGFKTFMVKTGGLSLREDIARVKALREAAPEVHLIVDANQGWDRFNAIQFGKAVEECEIEFLEQPVPYWDTEGLAMVRKAIDIPVSVDETLCTIHDAVRVIKEGAADIFSIKVTKNGGIYRAKEILDLAKAFGIKCWMNSMIEQGICQAASLQLGVYAENTLEFGHSYASTIRLEDDITTYSEQIHGSVVRPNGKPGLGIEIREEVLKKYAIEVFTVDD